MNDSHYYQNLPKKSAASGVLFVNNQNELLIVNPTYKEHWAIPGGTIDANESPRQSAIREVKEELGLAITDLRLLGLDYVFKDGDRGDWYQFIFFGGCLSEEQILSIRLQEEELSEYKFVSFDTALQLLSSHSKERVRWCLTVIENEKFLYLENSQPVD